MKKNAFTLAEVLITLGIIGIVAAMTLPALIQKKQNRELKAALEKNYSVLQAALQKAEYESGEAITPQNSYNLKVKPLLMNELKLVKDCNKSNCVTASSEDDGNGNVITFVIKNYKTYNKNQTVLTTWFDDGQFMLADGSMYLIENPNAAGVPILITIDVNGIDKKPNIWGHDLFTFQIVDNGKLLPMGAEGTLYKTEVLCSTSSSNRINGIACTHSAITDRDYWNNLP